jgi:hypothetical protein
MTLKFHPLRPTDPGMNSINGVGSAVSSPALSTGLATVSAGTQRLDQDAQQIANPDQTATGPLLDLGQASLQAQAGVDVIRTANQMLGSLFNAFA